MADLLAGLFYAAGDLLSSILNSFADRRQKRKQRQRGKSENEGERSRFRR